VRLNFREYGAGDPPLIILHGLFGSAENWHTIARRMEGRRRIIAADLRNHGDSPHDDVFTFPAMASDVAELLDLEGIASADILGHSLGGKVAMELALARPELVSHLVVVDIAPKRYRPHNVDLKDAMLSIDLAAVGSRRDAEGQLAKRVENRTIRLFLLKNLDRDDEGAYRWRMNLEGVSSNFEETGQPIAGGRSFEGPVLFLRGDRSDYVNEEEDEPLIHALFPNALIRTVHEATHWVHADQPDQVIDAVEDFLSHPD